jgi:plasmid replication initiation protein
MIRVKEAVLVEHNALISAQYDMTATEQNIFCMLIRQIKQEDPPDKIYNIYVKELEEATNRRVDYQQIQRSAKKLLSCICTITKENGNLLNVAIISDSEYIEGGGLVEIGISPKMRPYLFGLKQYFTKYGFHMFMALKSKYSKRMYKMLSQFKNTGVMRISVEELKHRLRLINPKTGEEKYTLWSMFAAKVLEVSKRELQTCTDIHFTYAAKKTGRKFTSLEFKIKHIPQQLALKFGEDKVVSDLQQRLTKEFGLSVWQANDIVVNVPEKEIARTLYAIKLKKLERKGMNLGGITAQIFENKFGLGLMGNKPKASS